MLPLIFILNKNPIYSNNYLYGKAGTEKQFKRVGRVFVDPIQFSCKLRLCNYVKHRVAADIFVVNGGAFADTLHIGKSQRAPNGQG